MSVPLRLVVVACALLLAALVLSFVLAGSVQGLREGGSAIAGEPWGVVTLLDLYVGLLFVAAWIHALEGRWPVTLAWAFALMLLGNAATLAYLLWRARRARSVRELLLGAARF